MSGEQQHLQLKDATAQNEELCKQAAAAKQVWVIRVLGLGEYLDMPGLVWTCLALSGHAWPCLVVPYILHPGHAWSCLVVPRGLCHRVTGLCLVGCVFTVQVPGARQCDCSHGTYLLKVFLGSQENDRHQAVLHQQASTTEQVEVHSSSFYVPLPEYTSPWSAASLLWYPLMGSGQAQTNEMRQQLSLALRWHPSITNPMF